MIICEYLHLENINSFSRSRVALSAVCYMKKKSHAFYLERKLQRNVLRDSVDFLFLFPSKLMSISNKFDVSIRTVSCPFVCYEGFSRKIEEEMKESMVIFFDKFGIYNLAWIIRVFVSSLHSNEIPIIQNKSILAVVCTSTEISVFC